MAESDQYLPLAILVFASLIALVFVVVALIRSGRIPGFPTEPKRRR